MPALRWRQVLHLILGLERVHRIVEYSSEVSMDTARALELALPGAMEAAEAAVARPGEVSSEHSTPPRRQLPNEVGCGRLQGWCLLCYG